ncbi:hypothetical protein KP509_10G048400 [Ceratopteris richardii]|uniref:Uncharacterized protein n=1 Tax=Ceratopteris richardii TaxID=49495 RepID=A0A8T2U1K4_CERRI|nr:hypothetical protein KP509_10G048400 [Ceratopteris richardii]
MHVLRAAARKRIITRASFFAHGNRFDSAIEVNSATSGRNSKRPAPGVTPFFLYRPCSVNTSQKLQNVRYYDTYNPSSSASPKAKLNEASEAQTTSSETLLQDSRTPVLEADESSDMHEPETPRNSISCSVSTDTGAPQLELRSIDSLSDDSEQSLSAVEDRETPIESSEYEDEEEDDTSVDQGNENSNLESGRESAVDLDDDIEEECAIDMANVPEDLKEMLDDNYELDSADDDLTVEGPIELLTLTEVKQVMEEVRARDVQIFSVSDRCEWTDIMVIATGISDRHVRGIADALVYKGILLSMFLMKNQGCITSLRSCGLVRSSLLALKSEA